MCVCSGFAEDFMAKRPLFSIPFPSTSDSFGCLEALCESVELRNVFSSDTDFRGFDPFAVAPPPRLGGRASSQQERGRWHVAACPAPRLP
jgi:hypothetical protein